MVAYKCVDRLRGKNGTILGYILEGDQDRINFTSEQLKNALKYKKIEVSNLTLTSDNRIIMLKNPKQTSEEKRKLETLNIRYKLLDKCANYIAKEINSVTAKRVSDIYYDTTDYATMYYDIGHIQYNGDDRYLKLGYWGTEFFFALEERNSSHSELLKTVNTTGDFNKDKDKIARAVKAYTNLIKKGIKHRNRVIISNPIIDDGICKKPKYEPQAIIIHYDSKYTFDKANKLGLFNKLPEPLKWGRHTEFNRFPDYNFDVAVVFLDAEYEMPDDTEYEQRCEQELEYVIFTTDIKGCLSRIGKDILETDKSSRLDYCNKVIGTSELKYVGHTTDLDVMDKIAKWFDGYYAEEPGIQILVYEHKEGGSKL